MKSFASPARPASGRAIRVLSAVLLYAAALSAPGLAYAAHGGGGGGGGGGFHGGGGGFHGGGMGGFHGGSIGGFHGGGVGGFHGGSIGGVHGGNIGGFHAGGVGALHGGGFRNGGFAGRGFAGSGFAHSGFAGGGVRPQASFGAGMDRFHAGSSREGSGGNSIVLRGGAHGGQWHRGWHDGRFGWWWGADPYLWSNDGSYDDSYADGASDGSQSWYCSDPAGYYPAVSQCNTTWQAVPGN
jgi:hypothetical protein